MQNKNEDNEVVTKGYLATELKKFGHELKADLKAEFKSEMNNLAVIINGAFAKQQKYMDDRFERIENRLDKVEYKVDVLQDQMELVNKRQIKTEKRIEKLEVAAAT